MLKGVASLSAEMKAFSDTCFGEISRVAAHINLAYHQVSSRTRSDRAFGFTNTVYPCNIKARPLLCAEAAS